MRNSYPADPDLLKIVDRTAIKIATSQQRIEETHELLRRSDELLRKSRTYLERETTATAQCG